MLRLKSVAKEMGYSLLFTSIAADGRQRHDEAEAS